MDFKTRFTNKKESLLKEDLLKKLLPELNERHVSIIYLGMIGRKREKILFILNATVQAIKACNRKIRENMQCSTNTEVTALVIDRLVNHYENEISKLKENKNNE